MKSTIIEYFENLKGKTVSLIGFGVSHRPVADLFLSHGVSVVVHDKKTPEQMSDVLKEYEGKDIKFVLGENYLDGVSGDVVFRTPGMYFNNSDIAEAIRYAYMNGASVINMSFGGSVISMAAKDALENAYNSCILVAAAADEAGLHSGSADDPTMLVEWLKAKISDGDTVLFKGSRGTDCRRNPGRKT